MAKKLMGGGKKKMLASESMDAEEEGGSESEEEFFRCANEIHADEMTTAPLAQVKESVISTAFHVQRETTIPSDNVQHKVNVTVVDLKATFEHETVPSRMPHAFLKAKVTNTSQYPFLPGPASVFLDNNFVAKSCLKAVSPSEEFSCSLGVDPAVRVDYKPVKKFNEETGLLSKTAGTTVEQRIELNNTRSDKVNIRLLEQIPLSGNEKLKIMLLKPEFAKSEAERKKAPYRLNQDHILEWDVVLEKGEKKELLVAYKVEHPAGERIIYDED